MDNQLFSPEEIGGISLADVIEAYYDCRRRKRMTMNAIAFEMDYERNCIELWQELNEGRYKPRRSIAFIVDRPVKREIFAADFRDRVVHHLIARRVSPNWYRHCYFVECGSSYKLVAPRRLTLTRRSARRQKRSYTY